MKNSINSYVSDLLTKQPLYIITPDDQKMIDRNKTQYLINKLTRKKFRRHALTPQTLESVSTKITASVKENQPIHLVVPFGGYKHFWNPSHPEPDWAELFSFRFVSDLVAPLLAAYEPGVIIEYMSEDMILNRMNNYPIEALETYSKVFQELISWFKQYAPKNLDFRFFRVGDRVNKEKLILEVEKLIPERKKSFELLTSEQRELELHRSNRSVFWEGSKDLSHLSDKEKQHIIIDSRIIELAYYETEAKPEFLGEYLSEDNHICLLTSFGTTHDNDVYQDLTIGSAHGSIVDFWIGRGILEKRGDILTPKIISAKQYAEIQTSLKKEKISNILSYKNYQEIEVFEAK